MNPFKQAQDLMEKMNELQNKLEQIEVIGESGTGLVKVTMNCKNEVKFVKIDQELIVPNDVEILEDLVIAAINDAKRKVDAKVEEESKKLAGLMPNIPGIGF
ncbi:MAG: YbaB/EbfC family nucleoid-associated protein [Holosporales bacterium]|jgi:DNA-binding YbaB/EbfC family protein|nr:YbaB/EbfC family nucleoid-associated protein [Holosporales bacterium]